MWAEYPDVVLFYSSKQIPLKKLMVDIGIIPSNAEYKRKLAGIKLNDQLVTLDQLIDITKPSLQEISFGHQLLEVVVPCDTPWLESLKWKLYCIYKYLALLSTNRYNSIVYSFWWMKHVHNPIVRIRMRHGSV